VDTQRRANASLIAVSQRDRSHRIEVDAATANGLLGLEAGSELPCRAAMEERVGERFIELDASRRSRQLTASTTPLREITSATSGAEHPKSTRSSSTRWFKRSTSPRYQPPRNASLVWSRDRFAKLDLRQERDHGADRE
jgi:hypothetical protein